MSAKYATFEVRQGDTFNENLILENTTSGTAIDLSNMTIEAYLMRGSDSIELDVTVSNAANGAFTIGKSAESTKTWAADNHEGYITLVESGTRTSSENFTVKVIEGAVDVQD